MNTVRHIGLILDGNRRYSERVYSNRISGHSDGFQKLKEVLKWCSDAEIPEISVYAFSYDNWNRPEAEVSTLLSLFEEALTSEDLLNNRHAAIRIVGNLSHPQIVNNHSILNKISNLESKTSNNTKYKLNILFSYSGAEDIKNLKLNGELLSKSIPDLDLIIRTGGSRRLSDFLPLQSAYAELYFTDTLWPEFTKDEFDGMLSNFKNVKVNKGK